MSLRPSRSLQFLFFNRWASSITTQRHCSFLSSGQSVMIISKVVINPWNFNPPGMLLPCTRMKQIGWLHLWFRNPAASHPHFPHFLLLLLFICSFHEENHITLTYSVHYISPHIFVTKVQTSSLRHLYVPYIPLCELFNLFKLCFLL